MTGARGNFAFAALRTFFPWIVEEGVSFFLSFPILGPGFAFRGARSNVSGWKERAVNGRGEGG